MEVISGPSSVARSWVFLILVEGFVVEDEDEDRGFPLLGLMGLKTMLEALSSWMRGSFCGRWTRVKVVAFFLSLEGRGGEGG